MRLVYLFPAYLSTAILVAEASSGRSLRLSGWESRAIRLLE